MRKIPLFLSIIVAASMILGKTAFAASSAAVRTPVGPAVQTAPVSANADAPRKAFIASADKFAVIGPQNILYNSDSADAVQMKTAVTAAVEDWYSRLNMTIDGHMVSLYTAQFNPSMRDPRLQIAYNNLYPEMYQEYGTDIYYSMVYCFDFQLTYPDSTGIYSTSDLYTGFCNADGTYYCIGYGTSNVAIPAYIAHYTLQYGASQVYQYF